MKLLKKNEGITLVALVVTIIVLIILAGVSISLVLGQDGVVQKAKAGRDNYAEAARLENEQLANVDAFTMIIGDTEAPGGTISVDPNTILGIRVTVTAKDLGSGVDFTKCKYIFTNSADELGTDISAYTEGDITEETTVIEKKKAAGTYYLHVLLTDNEGCASEIVSNSGIEVKSAENFDYTGEAKTVKLLPGNYKLEVWGAQGGTKGNGNSGDATSAGRGGYSYGTVNLKETQQAYIYVGGKGASSYTSGTWAEGGFNGGGRVYCNRYSSSPANAGGGATDIRFKEDDLYSRLIVAGGGGGYASVYGYSSSINDASYGYGGGSMGCQPMGGRGNPGTSYAAYYYRLAPSGAWNAYSEASYSTAPTFGKGGYQSNTSYSYTIEGGRRRLVWWIYI